MPGCWVIAGFCVSLGFCWQSAAQPSEKTSQLGGQKGVVFKRSQEYEALQRWTERQFLEVERNIAKQWRRSLTQINFEQMVKTVMGPLGHWRKPKSLADAKLIADNVIDNLDPEWLLRFGLTLLGVPEAVDWTINEWISHRRPPLRDPQG